jgi:hypothetical protein
LALHGRRRAQAHLMMKSQEMSLMLNSSSMPV